MNNFWDGIFYFDPNEAIFETHFVGAAVVPGSMIIGCFLDEIIKKIGCRITDLKIKDFTFKKFISPGKYKFHISIDKDCINCMLYMDGNLIVKGEVFCKNE